MSVCETGSLRKSHFFSENASLVRARGALKKAVKERKAKGTKSILIILREKSAKSKNMASDGSTNEDSVSAKKLFNRGDGKVNTENLRTKEVDDISKKDIDIIEKRIQMQQEEFIKHKIRAEKNKITKVLNVAYYLTEEEASIAISLCNDSEDNAILKMSDPSENFLSEVRKEVAVQIVATYPNAKPKRIASRKATKGDREKLGTYVRTRLDLDDAMANIEKCGSIEEAMKDWSPARIRAWKQKEQNPNAYYYRFNDIGFKQAKGGWSKEEEELFFDRLREMGANGQWGIFSRVIPGRVGYQCSNFYRKLLKDKVLHDDNYYFDEKGNTKYKFKGKNASTALKCLPKASDGELVNAPKETKVEPKAPRVSKGVANSKRSTKVKKRRKNDDSSDEEEMNWKPERTYYTTKRLRLKHGELNEDDKAEAPNPLPGFKDPVTLDEVIMPAISPSGQVMSYSTWTQCMEHNGLCPLTKQPINKKELVLLTPENIEHYRPLIANNM